MLILGINFMFSSCESKKNAIQGYEWLEGEWVYDETDRFGNHDWAKVEITKSKYKQVNSFKNPIDFKDAKPSPIAIGNPNLYYPEDGNFKALDTLDYTIGIDMDNMNIFVWVDQYKILPLNKVVNNIQSEEDVADSGKVKNKKKTKYKASSKNVNILAEAFNNSEYLMFATEYMSNYTEIPLYILLHPFTFSEDALQGIIYYIEYGEDKFRGYNTATLNYFGEYEIIGNHIRVRDIFKAYGNAETLMPLTYEIANVNGELRLIGGATPQKRTDKDINRQITKVPNIVVEYLEQNNKCHHK